MVGPPSPEGIAVFVTKFWPFFSVATSTLRFVFHETPIYAGLTQSAAGLAPHSFRQP